MMSLVIAVDREEEGLARTLACLVPAVAEGVLRDAVVLDTGGAEATAAIADAAGCHHIVGEPHTHLGNVAELASAEWLLMLKPGVILEHDWFREAAEFGERAEAMGQKKNLCAAFSYSSQRFGLMARIEEAWRFIAANLLGRVVESQGLIVARDTVRRISGSRSGVSGIPPRPPTGSRLVVLRAKAHAPDV